MAAAAAVAMPILTPVLEDPPPEPGEASNTDVAPPAPVPEEPESLGIDKDNLKPTSMDLEDPHVSAIAFIFVAHNMIRRNLLACSHNVKLVTQNNVDAYCFYANFTLQNLDHAQEASDSILFPAFTQYNKEFFSQILSHKSWTSKVAQIREYLPRQTRNVKLEKIKLEKISTLFQELYDIVNADYIKEEELLNSLGHRIPTLAIQHVYKEVTAHRAAFVAKHGKFWSAVYIAYSLTLEESFVCPPIVPRLIANGIMTAGALQFRKELQFSPKVNPAPGTSTDI